MGDTTDKPTARSCIFCGAPADSREHILSDWLRDVLPSDETVVYFLSLEPLDNRLIEPPGRFGYFAFLAVGGLSFLVIGHGYRNRVVIDCREPIKDAVTKIWPVTTPAVSWPPAYMMDTELIDVLFERDEPPVLDVRVFRAS